MIHESINKRKVRLKHTLLEELCIHKGRGKPFHFRKIGREQLNVSLAKPKIFASGYVLCYEIMNVINYCNNQPRE